MNAWSEIRDAMAQARETFSAADSHATQMANLVQPRLRQVANADTLRKMKAELQNFNAVTGKWKTPK